MTLLVALHGQDGIVLAADSRGTFGDPRNTTAQNDSMQKAHILSDHVAALAAGSGEIGAMVIDSAKTLIQERQIDGASEVMELLRETVRTSYQNWFPSVPPIQPIGLVQAGQVPSRPNLAFLVAGYEQDMTTPRIFNLQSQNDFNPMLHDYGFAILGVGQYALYLLNRLYQPDRTTDELMALAVYVITETACQDGKVGGPVNVIKICPDQDGCQIIPEEVVANIQSENDKRSRALRESFYRGE